jgi:hypothetical protein
VAPPTHVMGLREPPRPAAGEPSFSIPVANLADHPLRRLPGQSTEPSTPPAASSTTVCTLALQRRRRTVSGWTAGPPSISHPPDPSSSPARSAWITTVAPSGSVASAARPEHRATRASARRASAKDPSPSPGIGGTCFAIRSIARATTAPCAAGSSASKPNRLPSSHHHQESERARSTSTSSSRCARAQRSPRWRTAAHETCLDQTTRIGLGFGGGEPRQLHDLVDPHLPARQGCREPKEVSERVTRGDPAPRLPAGDAVAHGDPVRHVARSRIPPGLPTVGLGDQREHPALGPACHLVRLVQGIDQPCVRSRMGIHLVERMFDTTFVGRACL